MPLSEATCQIFSIDRPGYLAMADRLSSEYGLSVKYVLSIGRTIAPIIYRRLGDGKNSISWNAFCSIWKVCLGGFEPFDFCSDGEKASYSLADDFLKLAVSTCNDRVDRLIAWYKLGKLCLEEHRLVGQRIDKLRRKYLGEGKYRDHFLSLFVHHNTEADYFVALKAPTELRWDMLYSAHDDDKRVIARAGFRIISPEAVIVEVLQGCQKFEMKTIWSHTEPSWYRRITGNCSLLDVGWRKLLVSSIEHIAAEMGARVALFRPGESMMHRDEATSKNVDVNLRYDGTALKMGYEPQIDSRGQLVYVKYLVPGGRVKGEVFTLPFSRDTIW